MNTREDYLADQQRIVERGRQRIDWIDHTLQTLLVERAALAKQLGWAKQALAEAEPPHQRPADLLHVPAREQAILDKRLRQDRGDLLPDELFTIWRAIMHACLRVQQRQAVTTDARTGLDEHSVKTPA